jgi:hypothetical protein
MLQTSFQQTFQDKNVPSSSVYGYLSPSFNSSLNKKKPSKCLYRVAAINPVNVQAASNEDSFDTGYMYDILQSQVDILSAISSPYQDITLATQITARSIPSILI